MVQTLDPTCPKFLRRHLQDVTAVLLGLTVTPLSHLLVPREPKRCNLDSNVTSTTSGKFCGGWKFALVIVIHQDGNVAPDGEELSASTSQAEGQIYSPTSSSKYMEYFLFPLEPNLFATIFSLLKQLTDERVPKVLFQTQDLLSVVTFASFPADSRDNTT
jgi:hypothetical protein